ncbi:MAG TPA: amidohydrolase family protein, partial [Rectinemataceae bacterium]|nr:amidohydrolase family protein [Rectinemataceae bacterium]
AEGSVPQPGTAGAGAALIGADLLRNWLRLTGASLANAARMLSLTPARALGMEGLRGALAPGLEADLVVWNGDFESVREIL